MLQWPYLWHPLLDCVDLWIYCSSHMPLLTYQRDLKEHNLFDRNNHRKFPRKQKEIHLQSCFGRQPISLSSTVGSCLIVDMGCVQMLPSFQMVEIRNTHSDKVSFMLNSSSSIFWLARFYSDLGRFNRWIIPILRCILQDYKLYILTVGFKNKT